MAAQGGGSLEGFLAELRPVLHRAFCLHSFPSESVERHNKPIIEVAGEGSPLVLPPVTVSRSAQEAALVEQSVNSTRVSLRFRAGDGVEEYLLRTLLRFLVHRADQLDVVRRVALPGWDATFLVTDAHLRRYRSDGLVHFICQFVSDLHAELSAMKLSLRSRARAVAADYWKQLEALRLSDGGGGAAATTVASLQPGRC